MKVCQTQAFPAVPSNKVNAFDMFAYDNTLFERISVGDFVKEVITVADHIAEVGVGHTCCSREDDGRKEE